MSKYLPTLIRLKCLEMSTRIIIGTCDTGAYIDTAEKLFQYIVNGKKSDAGKAPASALSKTKKGKRHER